MPLRSATGSLLLRKGGADMLFGAKKNKIAALEAEIDSLQKKLRDAEATIADQKAKLVELKGQEGAAVGADEATQRVEVERTGSR